MDARNGVVEVGPRGVREGKSEENLIFSKNVSNVSRHVEGSEET